MSGKVYLLGAGPGDPGLLTVRAARALREADVVLHDDLVGAGILELARPGARRIAVGKRGGARSTPQAFIERLMVAEARQGRVVARLKGGDPFMFGRGGEECAALRAAGIDFEVVSGITAGVAAAASLEIPLTHREHCRGAIFVTGHEREGGAVSWPALVATGMPLVIYMGVARCEAICAALAAAGMPTTTPAAAVANASRATERSVVTQLGELPAAIRRAGIGSPAILIVGSVAALGLGGQAETAHEGEQRARG